MCSLRNAVLLVLLLLPCLAQAQQPMRPTDAAGVSLLPSAFASADNIAAQTATAMHGLTYFWSGTDWDRWTGAVTGSGNFTVVQPTGTNLHIVCDSGCSSSAGFADNSAFTFGTTAINPIGGVLDDTATNTATENSAAVARITAQKGLHTNLRNDAGTEVGTSGAPLRVDPTGTTTQPISAASLPLPTGAATSANQDGIIRDGTGDTTQANVSGGRLNVDGSGVIQPVSGTFFQATQPVSLTAGNFPDNEPFNVAQWNGSTAQEASNGKNTTGAGLVASATVGQCDDTSPTALTENQFGHARINCTTHHQIVEVGAALPAGTNNIGDVDVLTLPSVTIGTFPDNEPFNVAQINGVTPLMGNGVTGTGSQRVTIASDNTPFTVNVGTFPDNEPINLAQVAGTAVAAHDGATLEAPLLTSAYAETAEDSDANTNGNRVSADGDKVRLLADRNGTLYVRNGPPHRWSYHENSSSALTDTTVHASCGTGLFNYIESITASIGGATAFSLMIEDSTTTTIVGPHYLEAINGRGFHLTFPGGKKQTTSATLIAVTTTGAVLHAIDIIGFCAP